MTTLLKQLTPVAMKPHICNLCGCEIKRGAKYNRESVASENTVYDFLSHLECLDIVNIFNMHRMCVEGISQDVFLEQIDDYMLKYHRDDEKWKCMTYHEKVLAILITESNKS